MGYGSLALLRNDAFGLRLISFKLLDSFQKWIRRLHCEAAQTPEAWMVLVIHPLAYGLLHASLSW